MKLPSDVLESIIEKTEQVFKNYVRNPSLTKKEVIEIAKKLYEQKEIIWIENPNEVRNILKNSKNPWVYHHSLNLNWVLFFTILVEEYFGSEYETYLNLDEETKSEIVDTYASTWRLKIIFDHADGIIEDGDKVYIITDDYNLIKKGIDKFTLS